MTRLSTKPSTTYDLNVLFKHVILTGEYVCGVSDQPMNPVENRPLRRVRVRSKCGKNRLKERQDGGDHSQERVRLAGAGHPLAKFHENARGSGQR